MEEIRKNEMWKNKRKHYSAKQRMKKWAINKFGNSLYYLIFPSVARLRNDAELKKFYRRLKKTPGNVLFIGASWKSRYKKLIPHKKFQTLDIDTFYEPDIKGDVHNMPINDNTFDTVIITMVLEHCRNPRRAMDEVYRILRPDGICIASVPFLYRIHSKHDYFRFTKEGLEELFKNFKLAEIKPFGNRLHAIWLLITQGKILWVLKPLNYIISLIAYKSNAFPTGYVIWAKK
jgi:SAM-dependent methyltransferase